VFDVDGARIAFVGSTQLLGDRSFDDRRRRKANRAGYSVGRVNFQGREIAGADIATFCRRGQKADLRAHHFGYVPQPHPHARFAS
jgi:hypothetical protein